VFSFEMRFADGTPADPRRFTSAVPNWGEGDVVITRLCFEDRIARVDHDEERDQTVWTVELVPKRAIAGAVAAA